MREQKNKQKNKQKKIQSLERQILECEDYVNNENPLLWRSINAYKEYLPKLRAKLREIR